MRECFRFGDVGLVTADAQHSRVEFGGLHRARIVDVFREWPVARLAVDVHMLAALLLFQDLGMAVFAGPMAGKVHRASGDLGDGVSAVVSVLSETLRHKRRTHSQKHQATNDENNGQSKEVPGVFEGIHKMCLLSTACRRWTMCAESHDRCL